MSSTAFTLFVLLVLDLDWVARHRVEIPETRSSRENRRPARSSLLPTQGTVGRLNTERAPLRLHVPLYLTTLNVIVQRLLVASSCNILARALFKTQTLRTRVPVFLELRIVSGLSGFFRPLHEPH